MFKKKEMILHSSILNPMLGQVFIMPKCWKAELWKNPNANNTKLEEVMSEEEWNKALDQLYNAGDKIMLNKKSNEFKNVSFIFSLMFEIGDTGINFVKRFIKKIKRNKK